MTPTDATNEFPFMSEDNPVVIERMRAKAEADSIGPHASGIMSMPGRGTFVYFKVLWVKELRRVLHHARQADDIDSSTEWQTFKQANPERLTASLVVEWIQPVNQQVTLYFADLSKWAVELDMIAETGVVILAPPTVKSVEDVLEGGLMLQCDSPILTVLAMIANDKTPDDV